MDVREYRVGDAERIDGLIESERNAKRRDRFGMVRLALRGWEATDIAEALSSNRRMVQMWVYRYRDKGLDGLDLPPKS